MMVNATGFVTQLTIGALLIACSKAFSSLVARTSRPQGIRNVQASSSWGIHESSTTSLKMGMFDVFKGAFANEEYSAPPEGIKATARHILVKTPEQASEVLEKLGEGSTFASLANEFSTCPSGSMGGSLGSFSPGTMVQEFDAVIFDTGTNLGEVVGPVQTKFGYHLIVVDKRTGI